MDAQYHLGKLIAAAFNDPERIWAEHEHYRSAVLTLPSAGMSTDDLMAAGAALWKRALAKGVIPPQTGAN